MYDDARLDVGYISNRLNETVVRDSTGRLIQFLGLTGDVRRGATKLSEVEATVRYVDTGHSCHLRLDRMVFETPRLGYVSYDGHAMYVSRMALRRDWRQGIRKENLTVLAPDKLSPYPSHNYKPLVLPVQRRSSYPTVEECLDRVEDHYESQAFHPEFAVDSRSRLLYKGKVVGGYGSNRFELSEEYKWVEESLNNARTPVRTLGQGVSDGQQ